jgi:hypothetical protein
VRFVPFLCVLLCVHKLLKKATFVLPLNKYDLLDAKLRSGIQFREFVTSYKDRPNKTDNVLHCKSNFIHIARSERSVGQIQRENLVRYISRIHRTR